MPLLHEATDAKKMDTRMVERNTSRGVISHDEVQKALKQLPDESENADWIEIETLAADESESS